MRTFNLTDDHIKLLKNLNWSVSNNLIVSYPEDPQEEEVATTPFGGENFYEQIDLIINGKPEGFDPFTAEEPRTFTDDQKEVFDNIFKELPVALSIILSTSKFEAGQYKKMRLSDEWKKI